MTAWHSKLSAGYEMQLHYQYSLPKNKLKVISLNVFELNLLFMLSHPSNPWMKTNRHCYPKLIWNTSTVDFRI